MYAFRPRNGSMRKTIKRYKDKERRVIKYFAWFPITLGNSRRWLETVEVEQVYNELRGYFYDLRFTDQPDVPPTHEIMFSNDKICIVRTSFMIHSPRKPN